MRLLGYHLAAAVSAVALALSLASLNRVDYLVAAEPAGAPVLETRIGLFRRCDRVHGVQGAWRCRRYPKRRLDCPAAGSSPLSPLARARFGHLMGLRRPDDTLFDLSDEGDGHEAPPEHFGFCHTFVTAAYAAGLSIAFVAVATIAYLVTTLPQVRNRKRKQHGWRLCAVLSGAHAALQLVSISMIAFLLARSGRFPPGTHLGPAWALATSSAAVSAGLVVVLFLAEYFGVFRSRKLARPGERQPLLADAR